ncbi:inorganic pyrophosphatase [Mariprofundus erugo]|uniref:inorganic diphosphatase n=1 Tax=Mariprofundus erugo TaxID=2528639 RepID=A0A5R9GK20_9PROT|nr:inorganic pyrophosphatase [Mariprofundus erugo]TLS65555.1 inorganic pyrophosphatase [Mariprofundus erugo]
MKAFSEWRPHPWHGIDPGHELPRLVCAYIEIGPFDTVKFEVEKDSGYLLVDRSIRSSSLCPALYGFIPRTYCGQRTARLMDGASYGDGDPLDICVITERPISRVDILLTARVVGGFSLLDRGRADDKIIAIIEDDPLWSGVRELAELPHALIDRLMHYFLAYKMEPGKRSDVIIGPVYGYDHAKEVVMAARADYEETFAGSRENVELPLCK